VNPLFKAMEWLETGTLTDTVRDRLNLAAKLGLIDDAGLWMEMRAARNRIAHDHLPEKIKALQDLLRTRYREEMERLVPRLEAYFAKRGINP
jgi:hypothetical protein